MFLRVRQLKIIAFRGLQFLFSAVVLLLPFVYIAVPKAFRGLVAPGEADLPEAGIEHGLAAGWAYPLDIVLPELNDGFAAVDAGVLMDVFLLPVLRVHSGAFGHRGCPV